VTGICDVDEIWGSTIVREFPNYLADYWYPWKTLLHGVMSPVAIAFDDYDLTERGYEQSTDKLWVQTTRK